MRSGHQLPCFGVSTESAYAMARIWSISSQRPSHVVFMAWARAPSQTTEAVLEAINCLCSRPGHGPAPRSTVEHGGAWPAQDFRNWPALATEPRLGPAISFTWRLSLACPDQAAARRELNPHGPLPDPIANF